MHAVAEKGYGATTVADCVERAGVSRKTFYEHFTDKEAAFLAAYEVGVGVLLARLTESARQENGGGWRQRLRTELSTYLTVLEEEPAFAWALHVEVLAAGPAALERRAVVFDRFSERARRLNAAARREDPALPKLPGAVFRGHSGGVDELVREHLRTNGTRGLHGVAGPAERFTHAMFGVR